MSCPQIKKRCLVVLQWGLQLKVSQTGIPGNHNTLEVCVLSSGCRNPYKLSVVVLKSFIANSFAGYYRRHLRHLRYAWARYAQFFINTYKAHLGNVFIDADVHVLRHVYLYKLLVNVYARFYLEGTL